MNNTNDTVIGLGNSGGDPMASLIGPPREDEVLMVMNGSLVGYWSEARREFRVNRVREPERQTTWHRYFDGSYAAPANNTDAWIEKGLVRGANCSYNDSIKQTKSECKKCKPKGTIVTARGGIKLPLADAIFCDDCLAKKATMGASGCSDFRFGTSAKTWEDIKSKNLSPATAEEWKADLEKKSGPVYYFM